MSDGVTALFTERVRALEPYRVAAPTHRIKLNQNESTIELPDVIKETALGRLRSIDWARYPGQGPDELQLRLRENLGLSDGAEVLVGNGSNELIQALLMAIVDPGSSVVIPVPTFSVYRIVATTLGATIIEAPLDRDDLSFDRGAILERATNASAKAIVVCRPNNPTGTTMPLVDLDRLAAGFDGLVIVDEAYHDFAQDDALVLLEAHRNLVILRTFSKAYRAAGIRIGMLCADRAVTEQVDKVRVPFAVGHATRAIGSAIVEHRARLRPGIEAVVRQREAMTAEMARIPGIDPIPSQANFVCFRARKPVDEVFAALLDAGILIRDVSGYPLLENALRVSVGTETENRAFLDALRRVMKEVRSE